MGRGAYVPGQYNLEHKPGRSREESDDLAGPDQEDT